jgi:uncharacterized membrane protein YdjX (TVP38/TMEM64 family)
LDCKQQGAARLGGIDDSLALFQRLKTQMDGIESKADKRNGIWIKIVLCAAVVGLLTLVLYKSGALGFFLCKERITAFLDSLGPLSFVGFVVLQAAQVVVAPIPGEVTGFIGGYVYGPVLGVILSTIGLVTGSFVAFGLSRYFGRPFVERFIDPAVLNRFDYVLHHKGIFLVFMLFLIPGFPKDYLCFLLGLGHLRISEFLVVSTVGRIFGTILLTLGGQYIRHDQYKSFYVLLGAAIVVIFLVLLYRERLEAWLKHLHHRESDKTMNRSNRNAQVL